MRKLLLFCTLFLIFGKAYTQTTEEEYNYCTKGYAHQLSMGLDPTKADYEIKKLFTWEMVMDAQNSTTVDFIGMFYKTNKTVPKATILVLKKNAETPKYFCIPGLGTDYNIAGIANGMISTVPLFTWAINDYYQYMQLPANLRTTNHYMVTAPSTNNNTKSDEGSKGMNFGEFKGNGKTGTDDKALPVYGSGKGTKGDGVYEGNSGRNCIENCVSCSVSGTWDQVGDAYVVAEVTPSGKVISSRLADVNKYPQNAQFNGSQKVIAENCAMQRVYSSISETAKNVFIVIKVNFKKR